jgi:hypothetical protein
MMFRGEVSAGNFSKRVLFTSVGFELIRRFSTQLWTGRHSAVIALTGERAAVVDSSVFWGS